MTEQKFPKDAHIIMSILKDLGISDYEPKVVHQLLEFTNRYISSVLDDARAVSNHSKKKCIEPEDIKLAVAMQLDKQLFTAPPARDIVLEVARAKNEIPLPPVKPHCGVRLPPDRYCTISANYRLKSKFSDISTNKIMSTNMRNMNSNSMRRTNNVSLMQQPIRTQTISNQQNKIKVPTQTFLKPKVQVARSVTATPSQNTVQVKVIPKEDIKEEFPSEEIIKTEPMEVEEQQIQ